MKVIEQDTINFIKAHINERPRYKLAQRMGVSVKFLYKILHDCNCKIEHKRPVPQPDKKRDEQITKLYPDHSVREIAVIVGCHPSTVGKAAKRLKLTHSEETIERLKNESSGSQVHAVLESDLDVLMLQLKRDGATVEDYPPAGEIVTTDRINRVAGVLMSYVAGRVYGIDIPAGEYGAAVSDMQMLYRTIEPAGSVKTRAIALVEGLVHDYSLLDGLAHRVTTELPERTGNLGHLTWKNPFTDEVSTESFPEVFERALTDYELTVARFIETGDMDAVTGHINYSGRVLDADEEFDREE